MVCASFHKDVVVLCVTGEFVSAFVSPIKDYSLVNLYLSVSFSLQQTLHTTALVRRLIESQLKGQPNLRCLEFPSFFAAGFVQLRIYMCILGFHPIAVNLTLRCFVLCRYVPTDWALKTELTLDEVSELNSMNIELAGLLGKKNPAFIPFQHGNFSCIMIKEVGIEHAASLTVTCTLCRCILVTTCAHSFNQTSTSKSLFLSCSKRPVCMKITRR